MSNIVISGYVSELLIAKQLFTALLNKFCWLVLFWFWFRPAFSVTEREYVPKEELERHDEILAKLKSGV